MYPAVIGVTLAVMLVVGSFIDGAIGFVHAESLHQQQQSARLYMKQAEKALNDQIALTEAAIIAGQENQSIFSPGAQWQMPPEYGAGQTAYCPTSANPSTTCSWRMNWTATLQGSTSNPGTAPNEVSENINSDVDEKRMSFLLEATEVPNGQTKPTYALQETITLRVYSFAPYATVISKTNAKEFYAGSWTVAQTTEGDTAGCGAATCGGNTVIQSYGDCQTDPSQPIPTTAQTAWCDNNPKNPNYDHPITTPQNSYVNTTTLQTTPWNNKSTSVTP